MARFKLIILLIFTLPAFINAQGSLSGSWRGSLSIGLDFQVNFVSLDGGTGTAYTMDIPSQNAMNLPLKNVSLQADNVHFELESPLGLAVFQGVYANDSIKGKFAQANIKSDFYLVRGTLQERMDTAASLPYKSEEVEFRNGNIKFTGTLTLPEYPGNHPAVVLITGSGAQTRDEEIFGFKLFKEIADYLTRRGIAVLRYDDRGMGGSGGNVSASTTEDFARDVVEAVKYLQSRNDIRDDAVGLLGHSEGGVVAPIAYNMYNEIAFLVLAAGTGVTGEEIIYEQTALLMKAENVPDVQVQSNVAMLKTIFTAIKEGKGPEAIKEEIYNYAYLEYDNATDEEKKLMGSKEKFAELSYEQQTKEFYSNWFKYFLTYNPVPALEKVKAPVLLLFGELDLQVPPHQNRQPMEDALIRGGNKDYRVVVIPKANHLFQSAVTGGFSEYSTLPKQFAEGFLDEIQAFILERVPVSR
jgi:pimeloyl-ACP methyl ester carboxylesterase